jgi:transcription initiation factor IIE alpha subunit
MVENLMSDEKKINDLRKKVASMTDEQQNARIQELYAKKELTEEEIQELSGIMLGGI